MEDHIENMALPPLTQAETELPTPRGHTNSGGTPPMPSPAIQAQDGGHTRTTPMPSPQTRRHTDYIPGDKATSFLQAFFKNWTEQQAEQLSKQPYHHISTQWEKLLQQDAPYSQYEEFIRNAQSITWQLKGIVIQKNGIFLNTSFRRKYGNTTHLLRTHLETPYTPTVATTTQAEDRIPGSPETWPRKRTPDNLTLDNSPTGSYLEAATNLENIARISNIEKKLTEITSVYKYRLKELTQRIDQQTETITKLRTEVETTTNEWDTGLEKVYELYKDHDRKISIQHETLLHEVEKLQKRITETESIPENKFQQDIMETSLANCMDKLVQQTTTHIETINTQARAVQEDIDEVTLMAHDSITRLTTLCDEANAIEAAKDRQPAPYATRTGYSSQDIRSQPPFVTPTRRQATKTEANPRQHPRTFNPYHRPPRFEEEENSSEDDQDRHFRLRQSTRSFEQQVAYNCRSFAKCNAGKLEAPTDKDRPAAAMAYYTQIQSHALQYGIGLMPFRDITENTTDLYVPSGQHLTETQRQYERKEYMIALGHKTLEGLTCPNIKNAMLQQMGTHSDGYRILRSIIHSYIPDMKKPHDFATYAHQTTRPVYDPTKSLFWFQTTLTMYYQREHHYGREYLPGEQTNVFLAGLQNDDRFTQAIETIRHDCPSDYTQPVPTRYKLENIADTVAALASTDPSVGTDVYQSGNPSVNMMEADVSNDTDNDDPYIAKTNDRTRRPRKRPHVQCQICSAYGHDGKNGRCDRLYALMSCLEWLEAHPVDSKEGLKDYRHRHSPEQRTRLNQAIAHAAKAFGGTINMANITDTQQQALDAIGDSLAICRVVQADNEMLANDDPIAPTQVQPQVLQTLHMPSPPSFITQDHELEEEHQSTPTISKMVCTFPSTVTQGDTGANRGLTNDRSKLKSFRLIEPFPIGTIGPNHIMATGQGIMTLPTIEGHEEDIQVYYSKAASGSVISPDRHVRESQGRLQRWIQWGDPETGQGALIFMDSDRNHASTIRMYSRNGLWYAQVGKKDPALGTKLVPQHTQRCNNIRQVSTTEQIGNDLPITQTFHDNDQQILQETDSTLRHVHFTDQDHELDSTVTTTEVPPSTMDIVHDTTPYIARLEVTELKQGTRLPLKAYTRPVHGSTKIYYESMGLGSPPRTEEFPTTAARPRTLPTAAQSIPPTAQGRRRLYIRGRPFKPQPIMTSQHTGVDLLIMLGLILKPDQVIYLLAILHCMTITKIVTLSDTIQVRQRRVHLTKPTRIVTIGITTRRRHTFTGQQRIARDAIHRFRNTLAWESWNKKNQRKRTTRTFQQATAQSGLDPENRPYQDTSTIHTVEAPIDPNVPAPQSQLMTEIWHQRMGHIGLNALKQTSRCTTGMKGIGKTHPLFQCQACQMAKMTKAPKQKVENRPATRRGERFHMDFGFVRGPKHLADLTKRTWTGKRKQKGDEHPDYKPILTSHDGYSSYLLIVDAHTRAVFVYLTKSKDPPTETVKLFLTKFGLKDSPNCTIRTDQGGELARSEDFRRMIAKCGYSIEPTGTDNSSQNGRGERPHRTLANMMRCLLYSSKLGAEFWSDALVYACYIYNRTYHSALKKTPFESWTGHQPDLKHIRTFGTPVTVKRPGNRPSKLHPHVYHGIFLRFTGTRKNIVYYDISTGTVKIATHKQHDEFQYSSDKDKRSHASKYIIDLMADGKTTTKFGDQRIEPPLTGLMHPTMPSTAAAAKVNVANEDWETGTDGISDSDRWLQYKMGGKTIQLPTSPQSLMKMTDNPSQQGHPHINLAKQIQKDMDILQLELSMDPYAPLTTEIISTDGTDQDLGFRFQSGLRTPTIVHCEKSTPAGNITKWRSRFRNGTIRSVDNTPVQTIQEFRDIIRKQRRAKATTIQIHVAHEDFAHLHTGNGIPQLHFDQLQSLQHHLNSIKYGDDYQLFQDQDDTIHIHKTTVPAAKLTRRKLQKQPKTEASRIGADSQSTTCQMHHRTNAYRAQKSCATYPTPKRTRKQ